jgi:hypothetical protein
MTISSIASSSVAAVARSPEATEGPGPDRDGDGDDAGAAKPAQQAALPAGVGVTVDKSA